MIEPVIIGSSRLYLGDCVELMPQIEGFDAILTDPPYGLSKWSSTGGYRITESAAAAARQWDSEAPDVGWLFSQKVEAIAWGGNYLADWLGACRAPLVWDKRNKGMQYAEAEIAWTNFARGTCRILEFPIMCSDARGSKEHPTQKPVAVMAWSLSQFKPAPSVVLDPFMGSGTTGVACWDAGIGFIGIERDPGFFEVAVRRIEQAQRQGRLFE